MRLKWIIAPLLLAVPTLAVIGIIALDQEDSNEESQPTPSVVAPEDAQPVGISDATTEATAPATTTTEPPDPQAELAAQLATIPVPTYPEIACAAVGRLGSNKYLDRAEGLCLPIAEAYLDLIEGRYGIATQLDRLPPAPGDDDFVLEFFTQDVVHMVYVMSYESGGNPDGMLANGVNWGCPRQEAIAAFHPDPEGFDAAGDPFCPYFQNRVPISWVSHMAHTLEGRSDRTLGFLIDPYDLYEAALLGYALVFETGGNGWYHWWHIHWGLNRLITPLGIQGVYHCPAPDYWRLVRGGVQTCPYA